MRKRLFVLVVLAHHRRRAVHFNVTEHPTTQWTAHQIVDAFPDDSASGYLLRDRDRVYGQQFRHRVKGMGIEEVLTAPHSPWQNPFAERFIGSIRRECLNHVVILAEGHLRRILIRYIAYHHQARTHLALDKDAPDLTPIALPAAGKRAAPRSRWPAPSLHPRGRVARPPRDPRLTGRHSGLACLLSLINRVRPIRARRPSGNLGRSTSGTAAP
jgi:transposase InsO family protein